MSAAHIICVRLGLRIESVANKREHWSKKAARAKLHRSCAAASLYGTCIRGWLPVTPPVTITLTRVAPRKLDSDNLASGFKATRDGVAQWLRIDDGDERLTWVYAQRRGKPGEYDAECLIEWETADDKTVVPEAA
jgi:hypothetical protein